MLKVMSKMGISTYQSYCGAQIFDAVGLSTAFVDKYFTGTATTIEGVGLQEIAAGVRAPPRDAYGDARSTATCWMSAATTPSACAARSTPGRRRRSAKLQHAVRGNCHAEYNAFARTINEQSERLLTMRGLMEFKSAEQPVPLDEVEPAGEIVKRFATGAMSFGSISREAHTTLAIAMNRIGGRSNTGEGGEESDRLQAAAERRFHALGDQAGRVGPVRRHCRIPGQRRRPADQDGAGRQARRRRPASRPQGRQEHRPRAPFDAGRRA